ncbi:MAG TPA: isopentenyl phosphate kinase [Candidatus Saccharimonadales bacterium]|jgi:isopentenyl phosphate kinase|nr:isopentenyl phosphate kinase [Candidatus Saccharimonadales bacterium]
MKKLILIKLGGSIITDKSKEYVVRKENITRLAKEIDSALKKTGVKIIVGHGAGSFAHTPASIYQTKEGLINKKSLFGMSVTEEAARWLNDIVIKEFVSQKLPVFPFSPASFLISDTKVYTKSYIDPIKIALQIGSIPVVHGDVIIDKKIGCTIFSTEKVLSILAKELLKNYKIRIIYVTNVDGVYDEKGKTIPVITDKNFKSLKSSIIGASGVDVTGGMLHKVEESLKLAKETGIETLIINGNSPGLLKDAVLGRKVLSTLIS